MKSASRPSNDEIIRAWKNDEYRDILNEQHPLNLPENPAGVINLDVYRIGRLNKANEIVATSTQCTTTYCTTTECTTTACTTTACTTTACTTTACTTTACTTVWPSC